MNTCEFKKFIELNYTSQEAINTLCTNLAFSGSNIHKIMMTSCHAGEGKSFISMNLLRTMAGLGYRVVLVDADLRRSQIKSRFGMKVTSGNGSGTSHYLAGMCDLEDCIYATNIENAYIIPVGREVKNSLSLLNSDRLPVLLDALSKRFDYVLVDAPPVGVIIDAAQIARHCDGTLIVVQYNSVSRRELLSVKNQVESTGCEILGAVLNDVAFDTLSSKRYYNKSYYSHYYSGYYYGTHSSDSDSSSSSKGEGHRHSSSSSSKAAK